MTLDMTIQDLIDSGSAWMLEGHIGRQCMRAIEDGVAVLGRTRTRDYWGNTIPARTDVVSGTKGSQLFAHNQQGHEMPYARCRATTCALPRRALKRKPQGGPLFTEVTR